MWPWATSTQCHCSLIACRWQSLFRTHRWSRPCFPSTCGMWTGDLWAAATMASLFTQAAAGAGADFIKISTFTQNTGNEKITIWSQSLQLNCSRHTTDFFIFLNVTNMWKWKPFMYEDLILVNCVWQRPGPRGAPGPPGPGGPPGRDGTDVSGPAHWGSVSLTSSRCFLLTTSSVAHWLYSKDQDSDFIFANIVNRLFLCASPWLLQPRPQPLYHIPHRQVGGIRTVLQYYWKYG